VKVWLVQVGEPYFCGDVQSRLLRTGEIANFLASRGDDVSWFTSSFSHQEKKKFEAGDFRIPAGINQIQLKVVRSIGYKNHVSLRRLLDEVYVAVNIFSKMCRSVPPDLVVVSSPTIMSSYAAYLFCKKYSVPLVLDVRDLWPDIFIKKSPKTARILVGILVRFLTVMLGKVINYSTGIMATSSSFVDWACTLGKIEKRATDQAFPLLYRVDSRNYSELNLHSSLDALLKENSRKRIVVYAGSFSSQFSFDSILKVATKWHVENSEVFFVFCGDGPQQQELKSQAADNCFFTGWVGKDDLLAVLRSSSVAVAPYSPTSDFQENVPNKVIEYLANGIPIVSSLSGGTVQRLLEQYEIGTTVNLGSVGEWENALQHWLSDATDSTLVSQSCLLAYRTHFDADVILAEIGSYLDQFYSP